MQVFLTFTQSERPQIDLFRNAVVQPTLVFDQFVHHPRGGRPTSNEKDVVALRRPSIPKIFKCFHKRTPWGINPRHLIEEDNLSGFFRLAFYQCPKGLESLIPIGQNRSKWRATIGFQLFGKSLKLFFWFLFSRPNVSKGEPVGEDIVHQKSLPYTATAINNDKLRLPRVEFPFQRVNFACSCNNPVHVVRIITPTKIQKNTDTDTYKLQKVSIIRNFIDIWTLINHKKCP